MADQARTPATAWAGRCYVHFALPVPILDDAELALLDRTVGVRDGWLPVERQLGRPALLRRWQRPGGGLLVLVVLGWYPLLATLTANRAGAAGRRGLARVTEAVRDAGGRPVGDAELAGWVRAAGQRWALVVAARRRLDDHLPLVEFRTCTRCPALSARHLPHCRGCGHRFTSQEDLERDARSRAARDAVLAASAELAALGRGEGLFPRPPATAGSQGKVVA